MPPLLSPRSSARRPLALGALLVAVTLPAAAPASALPPPVYAVDPSVSATDLSGVASALSSDPVYVDPAADLAAEVDESRVRDAVAAAGSPVFVAVLPAAAAPDSLPGRLYDSLGRRGSYVVLAGRNLRAGSSETATGVAGSLAAEAVAGSGGDVTGALVALVGDLDAAAQGAPVGGSSGAPTGGAGASLLPVLLLAGAAGGGALLLSNRSRRRTERHAATARQREFDDVRRTAEEDVTALGEDLASIDRSDVDLADPDLDPRIRDQQLAAIQSYERARDALAQARTVDDLAEVSRALEDGRYAMTATRALMRDEPLPERRQPCFFDPRHGPSATDATWAPPGGQQRVVPVCAADAQRLARGEQAQTRMVWSHGQQVPMWGAPATFGPYAGGYFGAGTGLFGGLLLGSILTGPMLGTGYAAGYGEGFGDGLGGGGDFGGGGGDFGGGGGDFR